MLNYEKRLQEKSDKNLLHGTLTEDMELLHELASFDLGKYLLMRKGVDGFWTQYGIATEIQQDKSTMTTLEFWLYQIIPLLESTRERYFIFKQILQEHIKKNIIMKVMSIPCGYMDDLLTLDYSRIRKYKNMQLYGVDIDNEIIDQARHNALDFLGHKNNNGENGFKKVDTIFIEADAWLLNENDDINHYSEYDIITSNGLTVYEKNDTKVGELYSQFFHILKHNGLLITSIIVPYADWNVTEENLDHRNHPTYNETDVMIKINVLYEDIIEMKKPAFRTEEVTRALLEQAGFSILTIQYDSQHIYPTIVARANKKKDPSLHAPNPNPGFESHHKNGMDNADDSDVHYREEL